MRVDAHHHFLEMSRFEYPWLGPGLEPLRRDFGPADLQPCLARHGFDRSVLVQTISSIAETEHFLALAEACPFIGGVVGWVDLTDPGVAGTLDRLCGRGGLVGIRHQVHDEPDDAWLARADVRRGLAAVAERGLVYDLLVRPRHLEGCLDLARALPGLSLVVDHIAKPNIAKGHWQAWADGLAALAACPNVSCKLSGMITEADWQRWRPEDLRPYIRHVLTAFSPGQVMFGSDWPVCLLAGSYDRVVEAAEAGVDELTESERRQVFGGTATRIYGLEGTA